MAELVAFLDARLVDDTAAARQMQAEYVTVHGMAPTLEEPEWSSWGIAARVLREVEAKRAVLSEHQPDRAYYDRSLWSETCVTCRDDADGDRFEYPCPTLRHLASVYSDHTDFDPSWRR